MTYEPLIGMDTLRPRGVRLPSAAQLNKRMPDCALLPSALFIFMKSLDPSETALGGWRQFLRRMAMDRAVFYSVAYRIWQFLSGIVTLVLIARYFSPELQGFFYTYWSLIALQSFLELGFGTVILNSASHEWAQLHLDADGY